MTWVRPCPGLVSYIGTHDGVLYRATTARYYRFSLSWCFPGFARKTPLHTRQMAYTPNTTRRIDPDHYETSPSCDTFQVAEIYGCPDAHDHEADRTDMDRLAAITREDRPLEYRKKHALEVSS